VSVAAESEAISPAPEPDIDEKQSQLPGDPGLWTAFDAEEAEGDGWNGW
jgi:hypothetical protein